MTRARCRWLPAATLAGCVVLGATSAHADDPSAAALIDQGIDLREAQRDSEALALFEKAQSISPTPRGQAQVALAQQALGRWVGAEKNLGAALAEKDDPWIASHRPVLERALSVIQGHLGDVQIAGAASGSVFIDGVLIDDPDALTHLRLEVGRRTLEVRAPGMYPFYRVIDLHAGETERVEVAQHRLLDDTTTRTVSVSGGAEVSRPQRTLGWIFLGGAGLFLATGVAGLVERDVVARRLQRQPQVHRAVATDESMRQLVRRRHDRRGRQHRRLRRRRALRRHLSGDAPHRPVDQAESTRRRDAAPLHDDEGRALLRRDPLVLTRHG